MKRTLCAVVCGLMLSQAHAQQSGPGPAEQAAAPAASPASTPSPGTPLSSPAPAAPAITPSLSEAGAIDSALQTQIQDALDKDPMFSQWRLKVTVRADGIELSGDVASGRDRQNALRMAQSYARGKKVVNHVVVRGPNAQPGSNPPENLPANLSIPGNRASGKSDPP